MKLATALASIAALSAFAVAGCGGSSGTTAEVTSAASAADAIGCETSTPSETTELFVTDAAECTIDGNEVSVYYFSTSDARDSYLDIAGQFGGQYLVGDNFLVDASPEVLQELQTALGGDIRP